MIDVVQRTLLENQVILGEAMWAILHASGISAKSLDNLSSRIAETRVLIEKQELLKHAKHTRKRLSDLELINRIQAALDTAEEGYALIEVARNAHRAECELAAKKANLQLEEMK